LERNEIEQLYGKIAYGPGSVLKFVSRVGSVTTDQNSQEDLEMSAVSGGGVVVCCLYARMNGASLTLTNVISNLKSLL